MTTRLDDDLKREVRIGGQLYTLTLSPDGFKLTEKGKRRGIEVSWKDLVSGDAAMAAALQVSYLDAVQPARKKRQNNAPEKTPAESKTPRRTGARKSR